MKGKYTIFDIVQDFIVMPPMVPWCICYCSSVCMKRVFVGFIHIYVFSKERGNAIYAQL
jgi:hypothetical protein